MGIDDLAVILGLVAFPVSWAWVVRRTRTKDWWLIASHGVGALMAIPVMLAVFAVISDPGVPAFIYFGIVAGLIYGIGRPRATVPVATAIAKPAAAERQSPPPNTDHQAMDDIRRQSLEAMKRAEKARQADMQRRGDKPAKPLWMENHSHSSSIDDAEPDSPSIVTGRNLDVIRFDYVNRQGEFSSRRVKVTMVGAWHFEGIDLDKHAERTFRYDSVIRDITSEKTGEVLDPETWVADIRAQA